MDFPFCWWLVVLSAVGCVLVYVLRFGGHFSDGCWMFLMASDKLFVSFPPMTAPFIRIQVPLSLRQSIWKDFISVRSGSLNKMIDNESQPKSTDDITPDTVDSEDEASVNVASQNLDG
ncbi:hypothetical protein O6H91_20G076700 [Diphasiastrum complanatum]|uniref:Uncharacterized protein n=1 Tax=Diphasiastrum complanatum TaxID=34168 RepID=A0ACC2ARY2_DIPCM|nr:hypothetical protein O6H91_20G076700 [Diphasiastrum complanatum]